jgi:hypothetical protein
VKTSKTIEDKEGISLGALMDFCASCSGAGVPGTATVKAQVTFGGRLKSITVEVAD